MVFKFLRKENLYDSEEFYIKEAGWSEARELHQLFRQTFFGDWKGLPGSKYVIIAVDKNMNKIIGGIEATLDMRSTSADGFIAVLPEFRDKGIGKALLGTMEAELKKMGIEKVNTMPQNEKAWSILMKRGYDYTPETKADLRLRNIDEKEYMPGERLVKRL